MDDADEDISVLLIVVVRDSSMSTLNGMLEIIARMAGEY